MTPSSFHDGQKRLTARERREGISLAVGCPGDLLHEGAGGSPWILVGGLLHLQLDVGDAGYRFLAATVTGARSGQLTGSHQEGDSACMAEGMVRKPSRDKCSKLGPRLQRAQNRHHIFALPWFEVA